MRTRDLSQSKHRYLSVVDLSVEFDTNKGYLYAIRKVSFEITRGGAVGLWGRSGCGKSTIIKAVLGILDGVPGITDGSIQCEGREVSPPIADFVLTNGDLTLRKDVVAYAQSHARLVRPLLQRNWGAVFQEPIYSFEPEIRLGNQFDEVLSQIAGGHGPAKEECFMRLETNLARMNLRREHVSEKVNRQLSGGECQRIALSLALAGNPALLLADEPTTAMDRQTARKVHDLIMEQRAERQMSLIVSSHNRTELIELVDVVVILCAGRVVERLAKSRLQGELRDPIHPFTRRLWRSKGDVSEAVQVGSAARDGAATSGCPFVGECPHANRDLKLRKRCQSDMPPLQKMDSDQDLACWLFHRL